MEWKSSSAGECVSEPSSPQDYRVRPEAVPDSARTAGGKQSARHGITESQTLQIRSRPSAAGEVSPETVQAVLHKLLASRTFRSAEIQRRFLRYAVEETLAGRGHLIKEYVIAVEGLGREESFDPRLDPIVRTEARKLRARLTKYYSTEGINDGLRFDFRKGSYVPSFRSAVPENSLPA